MADGASAVGIDVGGTKILAGRWDGRHLSDVSRVSTIPGDGPRNFEAVRDLLDQPPLRDEGRVGISVPTSVGPDGILRDDDGAVGWGDYPLGRMLSHEHRRVTVFSDVECGAVAEARWGAGRDARFVLYITVGTGLSHCYVIDGRPLVGYTSSGYYSGYMLPARCASETCNATTIEQIAAGPGIARAYAADPRARDARPVFENARRGDPAAQAVIAHAAWHLGVMMADLIHVLNPEIIVMGGGIGSSVTSYREQAIAVARGLVKPSECRDIPVVPAGFDSTSCCVGAAALAASLEDDGK